MKTFALGRFALSNERRCSIARRLRWIAAADRRAGAGGAELGSARRIAVFPVFDE
jgi:hypothetical protein